MSQNERILNYLKPPGRKLTRLKAFRLFGTMCLNSRISELKKKGYRITSKPVKSKGKQYAEYEML